MIQVTEKAAEKLKDFMRQEGKEAKGLRVAVFGGGCAGFKYGLALEENLTGADKIIESRGVNVIVDPESAKFLEGSEIDYVESLQGSGFKINNPNVASSCRCGNSFKPKE